MPLAPTTTVPIARGTEPEGVITIGSATTVIVAVAVFVASAALTACKVGATNALIELGAV